MSSNNPHPHPHLQSLRKRSNPSPTSPPFPSALARLQTLEARTRSPASTSPLSTTPTTSSPLTTATTAPTTPITTRKRKPTSPPHTTPRHPKRIFTTTTTGHGTTRTTTAPTTTATKPDTTPPPTTTTTTRKRKPTSPPHATPCLPKRLRTTTQNPNDNATHTPPFQTVTMHDILYSPPTTTPQTRCRRQVHFAEASPAVLYVDPRDVHTHPHTEGERSGFAVSTTTTPYPPAPFHLDLGSKGLGPPIDMGVTGAGMRIALPGGRGLERWRGGMYVREVMEVERGGGRGRGGAGPGGRGVGEWGPARVLEGSPLASTPRRTGGFSPGVGISAQFRAPVGGSARSGGEVPGEVGGEEEEENELEVWDEYPPSPVVTRQPPPEPHDGDIMDDCSSSSSDAGSDDGHPDFINPDEHTHKDLLFDFSKTAEPARGYPYLGPGVGLGLLSWHRSADRTGAGLGSPRKVLAPSDEKSAKAWKVSFHLAAKTMTPSTPKAVRFELCYDDDSDSESESEDEVEADVQVAVEVEAADAAEGVGAGKSEERVGGEVEQEEEEARVATLTQPQTERPKAGRSLKQEPAPWPPIPGTVACEEHWKKDVARWWRVKQRTMRLVKLLGSSSWHGAAQGADDGGLQSLTGRVLARLDGKDDVVAIMQRFRLEEARFETAKAAWLGRWTKNIRGGVDVKTGARLDKLMRFDPLFILSVFTADELSRYLPFQGWGAYWVRQEAWLRKGTSETTGGENVGWGEVPPRSWDKLTSKQRAARADKFSSRGMMDIPPDIKGVLLMERVVKWWAAENPDAPEKVYGAVLIALDGLATEVGLVVEHEISTLVKRLDRLVSEVEESKVVIQYPDPLRVVEDPPANKNTPTWWDFDHTLAKAGNSLAAGTVWLGDQPSGLAATMAAKAKQLGSLSKPQNGPSDKLARFISKWTLGLDITEAVNKTIAAAQQVQNSLKSKPRVKGRIKKTYNKPRLGLDHSAASVDARKSKAPLPCWYHHREANLQVVKQQERRRKHQPPVPWNVGSIYGRPWILPLLQTFKAFALPMMLETDLAMVDEMRKLLEEERGAMVLTPLPGLKFMLDTSGGERRMMLLAMGSIFDDIVAENWGNCTPVVLNRPLTEISRRVRPDKG